MKNIATKTSPFSVFHTTLRNVAQQARESASLHSTFNQFANVACMGGVIAYPLATSPVLTAFGFASLSLVHLSLSARAKMQELGFKAQSNSAHTQLALAAKSGEPMRDIAFEETAVLDDIRRKSRTTEWLTYTALTGDALMTGALTPEAALPVTAAALLVPATRLLLNFNVVSSKPNRLVAIAPRRIYKQAKSCIAGLIASRA